MPKLNRHHFLTGSDATILALLEDKPKLSPEVDQILRDKLSNRGLQLARQKGYWLNATKPDTRSRIKAGTAGSR